MINWKLIGLIVVGTIILATLITFGLREITICESSGGAWNHNWGYCEKTGLSNTATCSVTTEINRDFVTQDLNFKMKEISISFPCSDSDIRNLISIGSFLDNNKATVLTK